MPGASWALGRFALLATTHSRVMTTTLTGTAPRSYCAWPDLASSPEVKGRSSTAEPRRNPKPRAAHPRVGLVDDDQEVHLFLRDLAGQGNFELASSSHSASEALQR